MTHNPWPPANPGRFTCLLAGVSDVPAAALLVSTAPSLAYLVFAASIMGFLFWNSGMRALGPKTGVLFINLVPVTAFVIAVLKGARPGGYEYAGVALVIAALLLNSLAPGLLANRQKALA